MGTTEIHPTYPTLPRDALSPRFRRDISLVGSSHLATSHQTWVHHIYPPFQILPVQEDIILWKKAVLLIPYYEMNYPLTQCFETVPTAEGLTWCWGCLGSVGQFFCLACGPMGWNIPGDSCRALAVRAGCQLGTHWVH